MTNGSDIKVRKRNGALTPLNLDKVHMIVEEACEGCLLYTSDAADE